MKSFLLGLFLIPLTFLTQESWVNVIVQTDQYGGETTWEIYQDTQVAAVSPPYQNNSYSETLVELPVGEYNLVVYDAFGDGICCNFGNGYFGLTNSCGLDTFVYDFDTPQANVFFELTDCEQPLQVLVTSHQYRAATGRQIYYHFLPLIVTQTKLAGR